MKSNELKVGDIVWAGRFDYNNLNPMIFIGKAEVKSIDDYSLFINILDGHAAFRSTRHDIRTITKENNTISVTYCDLDWYKTEEEVIKSIKEEARKFTNRLEDSVSRTKSLIKNL